MGQWVTMGKNSAGVTGFPSEFLGFCSHMLWSLDCIEVGYKSLNGANEETMKHMYTYNI